MATLHETILGLLGERGPLLSYRLQREAGGYRAVSAADYRSEVLHFSAYLHGRGIRPRDRVMLLSENAPEWTIAALAALNLGAEVVPVAAVASFLEIENTVREAQPRLCLLSQRLPQIRQVQELLESEKINFLSWDLQGEQPLGEWTNGQSPRSVSAEFDENACAFLLYTSGTTGHPKAVPISHKNILSNARAVLRVIDARPTDRLVSVLPLSHMLEFTGGFVAPTLLGCPVTYVKSLKAEDLLSALRDSRATVMIGVPLLFEVIARNLRARIEGLPLFLPKLLSWLQPVTHEFPFIGRWIYFPVHKAMGGHIRYFVAGGSKLQPSVFEFFRGIGITLLQGYGLTETSPVLSITTLDNAAPDHVGCALPGVEIGIFDDHFRRLLEGEEGEIWARGPNVFRGYLDAAQSREVFHEDWFRTGDLGRLNKEGLLRITGRKKDLIVTGAGKNVYPEEIEGVVLATGFFLEACALALVDSSGHEKVGLVLVPDRSKFMAYNFVEIRKECDRIAEGACRALAEYKWPQRIEVLFEELPKTSTRKIKKHEVRKMLAVKAVVEGEGCPRQKTGGLDLNNELEATIAQGISAITSQDAASIRPTDSLTKDLGLDSLTFVELVSQVEKKFNVKIEGIEFASILTVRDLVAALEFAAKPATKPNIFQRVYFTNFSPWENGRFFWRLPRRLVNVALRAFMRIRHSLKIEGGENLAGGPYILTPNHTSHFDLLSIAASIPGSMVHSTFAVAAKDYFFNRSWKALGARVFVNAIPFDRRGRVSESMEHCREVLRLGGSLVIFPEGTRSPDGKLQEFKPGVAQLLAGHPTASAVPVYIDGAYEIMPKGSTLPGPGALRVRYGKPVSFAASGTDAESLREIAERLRREVEALRP